MVSTIYIAELGKNAKKRFFFGHELYIEDKISHCGKNYSNPAATTNTTTAIRLANS